MPQIFKIAHEAGHCIDFQNGHLDFEKYKKDKSYRLRKEIRAWELGYELCVKHNIPTNNFALTSFECLKSYTY